MISEDKLFQPDKYKVYAGEGRTVGFCTIWNEPEATIGRNEKLLQNSAIVGTLYSRQGVNAIMRNLALNPQIRRLYLWGYGTLSNTPFGLAGKEVLEALWRGGIDEEHIVQGTKFKLDSEIPVEIVESIRKNVELIDVSSFTFDEALKQVRDDTSTEPYMDSQKFPDPVSEAVESFPSEQVGWLVRAPKIIQAWSRVVERIMRYGTNKGTQYGMQQRELIGVTWVISDEDPSRPFMEVDWPEDLRKTIGLTQEAIEKYHSVFLSKELPSGIYYTYGNRLMNYSVEGHEPVDQIRDVIIKQLASSPDSRRAVATTMIPTIDKDSKEPPCITQVQALQSGGALHFLATVRSHDIFKAAIPNAFGLRTLQKTVADELGFTLGNLQITSQSAHIYEADWGDAKKLAACEWWERPPDMVFKPEISADPRGMVVISIDGDEILAACKGPTGEDLLAVRGKTAKEVSLKIAHLDLLGRTDHAMDVAMELQKAEIAKRKGVAYVQDRPLVL
ncbi:MAG: thymidylate synthase [Patescibacteria group bacterium]